jgi:hypothetical protein
MIDLEKQYKTRNGYRVILFEIKELNSCGHKVTFPVKGTYYHINPKTGKEKPVYGIWKLDGKHEIFNESKLDLIEIKD